jgi:hypothetical protein
MRRFARRFNLRTRSASGGDLQAIKELFGRRAELTLLAAPVRRVDIVHRILEGEDELAHDIAGEKLAGLLEERSGLAWQFLLFGD